MKKRNFLTPQIEIIYLQNTDAVLTSNPSYDTDVLWSKDWD